MSRDLIPEDDLRAVIRLLVHPVKPVRLGAMEVLVRIAPLPPGNLAMYYPEANVLVHLGDHSDLAGRKGLRDVREKVASNAHVVKVRHGSNERATGGTYGHTDRTAQ
jgi:hypothetical protein